MTILLNLEEAAEFLHLTIDKNKLFDLFWTYNIQQITFDGKVYYDKTDILNLIPHLKRPTQPLTQDLVINLYNPSQIIEDDNGNLKWLDADGWWHLAMAGYELTISIRAIDVFTSKNNNYWVWQDQEKYYHIMKGLLDLSENFPSPVKAVEFLDNNNWKWQDLNDEWHKVEAIKKSEPTILQLKQ
jgi:hypothetical protein